MCTFILDFWLLHIVFPFFIIIIIAEYKQILLIIIINPLEKSFCNCITVHTPESEQPHLGFCHLTPGLPLEFTEPSFASTLHLHTRGNSSPHHIGLCGIKFINIYVEVSLLIFIDHIEPCLA
jgi:hypothetical protein